jgi:N-acetylglucosamine malate deacetylase 1
MAPPSPVDRVRHALGRWGVQAGHRLPPGVLRAINTARGIETPHLVACLDGERPVVLSPHPDDELIGAGGAMLAHLARGDRPHVVQLTSGERTAGLAHLARADRARTREAEALAAAGRIGLGGDEVSFLRLPDGGLDPDDDHHLDSLARQLDDLEPDLVYAPWPLDPHRDHVATTTLLSRVLRTSSRHPHVALYEVWSPLSPTHVVDVTDLIDTKLAALDAYRSALDSVDYRHTARGLAAYRSGQGLHGRGYAEAFTVLSAEALATLVAQLGDAPTSLDADS